MRLERLTYDHYEDLLEVSKLSDPWVGWNRVMFDGVMKHREGWVLIDNENRVRGHITLSDFTPDTDVIIHCSVHPEYQRRWLTKTIYKQVFNYIFDELGLPRCTGFAAEGVSPLTFHERLGFKREGIIRKGFRLKDEYRNLHLFGMLSEERRWR